MLLWALLTAAAFCFIVALYMALGSAPVRRLWDRLQHPGEYPTQRQYRRWRQAVPQSEPYVLSTVHKVTAEEYRQRLVQSYVNANRAPLKEQEPD